MTTLATRVRHLTAHALGGATAVLLVAGCFSSGRTDPTFTGRSPRSDAVLRVAAGDPPGWAPVDGSLACRYLLASRVRVAPAPPSP